MAISTLLNKPENAKYLLVLGHGASAGMRHRSMEALSDSLAEVGIATLRYNFPYMEQSERGEKVSGQRFHKPPLLAAVREAVAEAAEAAPGLPLFAGGRSMGGRMTSTAASETALPDVQGLVFFGFPLHPSDKPGIERAAHLHEVSVPMLFLQGTRDQLALPELLIPVVRELGARATLFEVEGADHSFHVPKSSGMTDAQVLTLLAETVRDWCATICPR